MKSTRYYAKYIDKFDYGNKDISDWDGKTDLDDDPRDLKGFWLETSLKISPLETSTIIKSPIFCQ